MIGFWIKIVDKYVGKKQEELQWAYGYLVLVIFNIWPLNFFLTNKNSTEKFGHKKKKSHHKDKRISNFPTSTEIENITKGPHSQDTRKTSRAQEQEGETLRRRQMCTVRFIEVSVGL